MIKLATKLIFGGLRRSFTKDGGSITTVTNDNNVLDIEGYGAIIVRGFITVLFAWLIAKLGLSPDLINTIVAP